MAMMGDHIPIVSNSMTSQNIIFNPWMHQIWQLSYNTNSNWMHHAIIGHIILRSELTCNPLGGT